MTRLLPLTFESNAARITQLVKPLAQACSGLPVFLVDGDRTLTRDDTSRRLLSLAGIDPLTSKHRFQREGYVFDAFRSHAEVFLQIEKQRFACMASQVAVEVQLYPEVHEFLCSASLHGRVFIVSAGIPQIWRDVLDHLGIAGVGVIGGIEPESPYVFGRAEKGLVAELFRAHANRLISIGDSDVDTEMLRRADHAVIAVNHNQNSDLLQHLLGHSSLWQVVPQGEPHALIPILSFADVSDFALHTGVQEKGRTLCR